MRQLAYIGEDGQVWVRDLDLDRDVRVSATSSATRGQETHTVCNWPTWSPDGLRLAYMRYDLAGNEVQGSAICVAVPDGSRTSEVSRATNSAPIYMCWAPDGGRLGVLMQEGEQLYLRAFDTTGRRPPFTVAQGAPLYFAWHPDSRGFVAHVGVRGVAGSDTRLVWIRMERGQVTTVPLPRPAALGFRAPSWSGRFQGATVAYDRPDGSEIAIQASPHADPVVVAEAGHGPAFVWSPSGTVLAFGSHPADSSRLYEGISVYDAEKRAVRRVSEEPALAFFWCSDHQIIFVTGEVGDRLIGVRLVDIDSGARNELDWVRPSRDLLLLLSHFDQYYQSAHVVSPQGSELVFATSVAQERTNGSVPTLRQVLVHSLTEEGGHRVVARGRLAVWRPPAPQP
ncbi:MAG: hypothetical protein GEU73_08950 [Chloroflexi bacterium]|nr:hypothetical protein [Chloroflexota bacterium]